jgi:hypothetical protein
LPRPHTAQTICQTLRRIFQALLIEGCLLPDCYSIIAAALLFKKIVKSSKDRRRKMLFHQTWSQSSEDRSENPKLGWSKFSASFIRLLLVALCGTIVYGSSSARESTEGSFPVPDSNGSSSITEYNIPTENSEPTGIALGSDGTLWYGTTYGTNIGRITTDGTITEYPIPSSVPDTDARNVAYMTSLPRALVIGADGAMWFHLPL